MARLLTKNRAKRVGVGGAGGVSNNLAEPGGREQDFGKQRFSKDGKARASPPAPPTPTLKSPSISQNENQPKRNPRKQ